MTGTRIAMIPVALLLLASMGSAQESEVLLRRVLERMERIEERLGALEKRSAPPKPLHFAVRKRIEKDQLRAVRAIAVERPAPGLETLIHQAANGDAQALKKLEAVRHKIDAVLAAGKRKADMRRAETFTELARQAKEAALRQRARAEAEQMILKMRARVLDLQRQIEAMAKEMHELAQRAKRMHLEADRR